MGCITVSEDREWLDEVEQARPGQIPPSVLTLARRRLDEVERLGRERDDLLTMIRRVRITCHLSEDESLRPDIDKLIAKAEGRERVDPNDDDEDDDENDKDQDDED